MPVLRCGGTIRLRRQAAKTNRSDEDTENLLMLLSHTAVAIHSHTHTHHYCVSFAVSGVCALCVQCARSRALPSRHRCLLPAAGTNMGNEPQTTTTSTHIRTRTRSLSPDHPSRASIKYYNNNNQTDYSIPMYRLLRCRRPSAHSHWMRAFAVVPESYYFPISSSLWPPYVAILTYTRVSRGLMQNAMLCLNANNNNNNIPGYGLMESWLWYLFDALVVFVYSAADTWPQLRAGGQTGKQATVVSNGMFHRRSLLIVDTLGVRDTANVPRQDNTALEEEIVCERRIKRTPLNERIRQGNIDNCQWLWRC